VGVLLGEVAEEIGETLGDAGVAASAGDDRRIGGVQNLMPGTFQGSNEGDVLVGGQSGKAIDGEVAAGGYSEVGSMHVVVPEDVVV